MEKRRAFASKHRKKKEQSAMEYLMTYGWAILIIAVVLGVLYYIGVFNGANLAPKLPPGACQVFRPNGQGSTQNINTQGECMNGLPEYVAQLNSNSLITINNPPTLSGTSITVTAWVDPAINNTGTWIGLVDFGFCNGEALAINTGGDRFDDCTGDFSLIHGVPENKWSFLAYTVNGDTVTLYYDSLSSFVIEGTAPAITKNNIYLGNDELAGFGARPSLTGYLANVQVYNTSLDPNSIQSLYDEGIGGAPEELQNLVAWWPLNGNANDYSGNQYNGASANILYVSSWTSSYT